ncbi:DUF6065 family protein [Bradyrhizobium sp. LHD-71]|uniref:DUF6065 family protein n=1 Tax=Bradyrhizobium sp. LHD-71 TaxID=3072141 RepID=UPI00280ED5DD|nr:DUF6065 family protein [Bradyrhizobium sp. LHD-71]MDQ8728098.1 DUF6065 family protein [Bradyrhizobium sp. LHD-71]
MSIEFLCQPDDYGVLAEPVPARLALPEWFRRIPAVDRSVLSATNNGLTVKRCMPFLDAMTLGYILPIGATVRLQITEQGRKIDAGWEFDRTMVSNHGSYQIVGHPLADRPPMKFHNYWTIKTPPGWSCLFMAPLNRAGLPVEIIAGVVDTDTYASLINFPFIATAPDGVHIIEKGTPLVQVIPFRREEAELDLRKERVSFDRLTPVVAVETKDEGRERERILRNTQASEGWYRKFARAKR